MKSRIFEKNLDTGKLKYLNDYNELGEHFGMWEYLWIKIFRLVVFSSAYDKNKIFFEARKERNGIGFSRFRDHLASIINWLEVVNSEVEVTNS